MKIKVSAAGSRNSCAEREDAPRGLGLFIPEIRRLIRLNREEISAGSCRFRDLDLSALTDSGRVAEYACDFLFREGAWYLQGKDPGGRVRVNDRYIPAGEETRLRRGDCVELGGGFRLAVRDSGAPGLPAGPELEQDMVLNFMSVSMSNGHLGIRIRYDAARRVLIREDWGVVGGEPLDNKPEERPVPENVTTREELYAFANHRGWEYCPLPEKMFSQDIMLWLGREAQVQYVAEKGEVLYRKWISEEGAPEPILKEHWCRFAHACSTEQKIREYVRRTWPHFPHNRRGELDSDMMLSMPADEKQLLFRAESREVVCTPSQIGRLRGEEEVSVRIPDDVTTRNELDWYLKIHRKEFLPAYALRDEMLRDAVLCAGYTRKGLKKIGWQTRYRASDRTVIRVEDISDPDSTASEPLKVPFDIFSMHYVAEYVKKQRPAWMK